VNKLILTLFGVLLINHLAVANEIHKVDLDNSELTWEGRKVTGAHHGTINIKDGSLEVVNGELRGGEFIVDMRSITNLDLEDETWNKKLVDHLKSDDFFSVEKFPVARFELTDIKSYKDSDSDANHLIVGDLTIKDITNSIEFPAVVNVEDGVISASAKIQVDRSKYDMRFRSGSFFENLGDKLIYDNFTIGVKLTATK